MGEQARESRYILGGRVDVTSFADSARQIFDWAARGESRTCCFSTVHMIMEAHDSPAFQAILNAIDLVHPDGMPLVWVQKLMGARQAQRAPGPDQTPRLCEQAARDGVPVAFYGGTPETLEKLVTNLKARFPGLQVPYAYSPPFRALTPEEDEQVVREIAASDARLVFVGLGCPKQERWVHEHRGRIPAVLLAVGAAFEFHAGTVKRAPRWLQVIGLEWLHRMVTGPWRLWKRYLSTNPRFIFLVLLQLLHLRRFSPAEPAGV